MPFDRFFDISRFLPFAGNENLSKDDRTSKVRNLVDYFNNKFSYLYLPESKVSIESLLNFKEQLNYV